MPAAFANSVGLNGSSMPEHSHIAKSVASGLIRKLPRCQISAASHNANMELAKNGGPNYLKAWREWRGLSQKDLASAARTSEGNLSDLEQGKRGLSLSWLRRFAAPLNISPGVLADYEPQNVPDDILAALLEATKPPQAWTPHETTIARFLEAAKPALQASRGKQADVLIAARAISAAIRLLARKPASEDDPGALEMAVATVADAVAQTQPSSSQAA